MNWHEHLSLLRQFFFSFKTNLISTYATCRCVAPALAARGWPHWPSAPGLWSPGVETVASSSGTFRHPAPPSSRLSGHFSRVGIRSLVFRANRSFYDKKEQITLSLFLKESVVARYVKSDKNDLLQSLFLKKRQERKSRAQERIPNPAFFKLKT